jgi:hypothetical protein
VDTRQTGISPGDDYRPPGSVDQRVHHYLRRRPQPLGLDHGLVDGQVAHETQYFADSFPAPQSRADLAEAIPDMRNEET